MVRVGPILLLILLSACSTSGDPGRSDSGSQEAQKPRDLRVERVASGAPGEGPSDPRVVLAPSAEALSRGLGAQIRGSGEGTYLAAYGGQQPTGGYSVGVAGARVEGNRVTVRVSLEGPPSDAIVKSQCCAAWRPKARVSPSWTVTIESSAGRSGGLENSGPWGAFGHYV